MREAVKVMVRCRPMSQNEIDRSTLFIKIRFKKCHSHK